MVKIIDKIKQHEAARPTEPYFSFEFFPPKTDAGVENLYVRMDKMTSLQPIFVDITWGAGGITKDLTMAISEYAHTYFGVESLMHLSCTNMKIDDIKLVLKAARESGIQNILALRGDPPKGAQAWEPIAGGLEYAIDLVKLIRKEHGDFFCIAVAGFPEGHPQSQDTESRHLDIIHLKQKLDAGADFVLTNFFYDPTVFIEYISECRAVGITCPIIPGMMPIQSFSSFQRMTSFCKTHVPQRVWDDLSSIADDDDAVKAYGVKLSLQIARSLMNASIYGFHFYTLNLERSVLGILKGLGIDETNPARRALPWRGCRVSRVSTKKDGVSMSENVRPINWANRPKSYIKRTSTWDEFPNGRWGAGQSPAFGELSDSHFYRPVQGSKSDRLAMWGEAPVTPADVSEVFAKYIEGKIPIIPWCESPLQPETSQISSTLASLNRAGFMTINSQPSANAVSSDRPPFGWGGPGGRIYQRAYVELFVSPADLMLLRNVMRKYPSITLYAVDVLGQYQRESEEDNNDGDGHKPITALTWGVFPNKEVLQPTIFDPETFLVWSAEAFQLWLNGWAAIYDDESESADLLYEIHDTFNLVAIIDNDYIDPVLFRAFEELLEAKR